MRRQYLIKCFLFSALSLMLFITYLLSSQDEYKDNGKKQTSKKEYKFSIRYLGVKVAFVKMIDCRNKDEGTVSVCAQSSPSGKVLFPIDNHYSVRYIGNYLPISYEKEIKQRLFKLEKKATFDRTNMLVTISPNGETIDFIEEGRDFFSSLLYLSTVISSKNNANKPHNKEQINFIVYANNNFWNATCLHNNTIKIEDATIDCYKITLNMLTNNDYSRSDVLTNNLIKEDTIIYLTFSDKEPTLPIKAEFWNTPFSVFWYLE